MGAGCPFITCAIKKKGIEFCWRCKERTSCKKWSKHREVSKRIDSFKCYQTLEADISFIIENGVDEFEKNQKIREKLLKDMLQNFNEGRSKSFYCIAATILQIEELDAAVIQAKKVSEKFDIKDKSKTFHSILDEVAKNKHYLLELRK